MKIFKKNLYFVKKQVVIYIYRDVRAESAQRSMVNMNGGKRCQISYCE